eukprot:3024869-Prymnesium_polylepis.1
MACGSRGTRCAQVNRYHLGVAVGNHFPGRVRRGDSKLHPSSGSCKKGSCISALRAMSCALETVVAREGERHDGGAGLELEQQRHADVLARHRQEGGARRE